MVRKIAWLSNEKLESQTTKPVKIGKSGGKWKKTEKSSFRRKAFCQYAATHKPMVKPVETQPRMVFFQFPPVRNRAFASLLGSLIFVLCLTKPISAWPTSSQWIPIPKNNSPLQDPINDTNGSRNIVSDPTHAAAFYFNDGAYLNFRMRLDADPTGNGGQDELQQFGWGALIDANVSDPDYEYMVMLDGVSDPENIQLWENTVQGTAGDPSDQPENLLMTTPVVGNIQIQAADTSINGNQDYFLDWRIPIDWFYPNAGIGQYDPIRLAFGSSPSAQTLSENGGDLVGGWSDYFLPNMTEPADGSVKFAADIAGNGDMATAGSGQTLYVSVTDNDRNGVITSLDTTTVTLTTANGDSETFTVTETGVDTGIFTVSFLPVTGYATINDGILQLLPGEVVTVTYIDGIDAAFNRDQSRTDTLTISPPVLAVTKTVSPASSLAGAAATATYTITITNSGAGDAVITTISDTLPAGFSYISGSTSGLTTANPVNNAGVLEWAGTWILATGNATTTLTFNATPSASAGAYFNNASVAGANFTTISTGNTAAFTVTTPNLALTKSVSAASAAPGAQIIYSVKYHNTGNATAHNAQVTDAIPTDTTYVVGSMRLGAAGSNYASATPLTDAVDADEGKFVGNTVIFTISSVAPDDSVADSGTDEGVIFFKVTIN